jgi:hypothetical protein
VECAGRAKRRRRFGFDATDSVTFIQSGIALPLPPHSISDRIVNPNTLLKQSQPKVYLDSQGTWSEVCPGEHLQSGRRACPRSFCITLTTSHRAEVNGSATRAGRYTQERGKPPFLTASK